MRRIRKKKRNEEVDHLNLIIPARLSEKIRRAAMMQGKTISYFMSDFLEENADLLEKEANI